MGIHEKFEQIIKNFVKWAKNVDDIRAAIIIGSRARKDHPADEWADLDILVITTNPSYYLSSAEWVQNVGIQMITFIEQTPGGDLERRVLFEGMLDVDFAIIPKERILEIKKKIEESLEIRFALQDFFGRGIRILIDKDNILDQIQEILTTFQTPSKPPPTEQEFYQVINDYLYHSVFTAKHLRRGEHWWAKMCLDCHMQRLLLEIIQWHALVSFGWNHDIWFRGRFLEEWADTRVVESLKMVFAHYNPVDIRRALLASMELFHLLVTEISLELRFSYSSENYHTIQNWIRDLLPDS
ncbi:MAG: aminoglycoside 6-adenylyltransferase [Candidatus Heimdallarchaeota archaeon]|nr:MAG: aminoglycoside 6-adenylyltransferase [Candidatus Heimdallarchaeota archaeon]